VDTADLNAASRVGLSFSAVLISVHNVADARTSLANTSWCARVVFSNDSNISIPVSFAQWSEPTNRYTFFNLPLRPSHQMGRYSLRERNVVVTSCSHSARPRYPEPGKFIIVNLRFGTVYSFNVFPPRRMRGMRPSSIPMVRIDSCLNVKWWKGTEVTFRDRRGCEMGDPVPYSSRKFGWLPTRDTSGLSRPPDLGS